MNTQIFATINLSNLAVAFHSTAAAAERVADDRDYFLATRPIELCDMPGQKMVELYNATAAELATNITPVKKFANKEVGARRLWANLVDLCELYIKRHAEVMAANKAKPVPGKPTRRGAGITLAPKAAVYPCREGSKQAILVDLLSRTQGATMSELLEALSGGGKPWQEVTVKSGLNWDMNKIKGYGIRTSRRGDVDCYHLVLPAGMDAPLPHTPRKSAGEDLVKRIKDWATANYAKSYGASALLETLTDAEMVQEFKTLKDARDWAKLQDEAYQNAQG